MVYMQPRANMSPVGRQPFRPGQWQGFKGVSKNTTYVQNNFFGGAYGNYYDSAMNNGCGGGSCGPSKFEKWMMGLGVGTTLLGSILSLFKKDKVSEQGSPQPTTNNDQINKLQDQIAELQKQIKDMSQPPVVAPKKDQKPVVAPPAPKEEEPKADPYKDFGKNDMICRDASGRTANISGKVNITAKGDAGQPPKEFTITDSSSGKPNTYTYKLTGESNGKPVYTCTSKNGMHISKGNQYELVDGQLVQQEGQDGYGSGLKTEAEVSAAATQSSAASPAAGAGSGTSKTQSVEPPKNETKTTYSQKEKDESRTIGDNVAEDLIGYTNDTDKNNVINAINSLKNDNISIVDFIDGYQNNKMGGNRIMEQINREFGWTNQETITAQKQIVNKLIKTAEGEKIAIPDSLKKFVETGTEAKLTNQSAANLDTVILELVEKIRAKQKSSANNPPEGGGAN